MKQVQELLHKQMTRKEFMRLFCLAVLALFGVNNFIAFLTSRVSMQSGDRSVSKGNESSSAFGTRKFGV